MQADGQIAFDPNGLKQLKGTGAMLFQKQGFFVLNYDNDAPLIDAQRDRVILAGPSAVNGYEASLSNDLVIKKQLDAVETIAKNKLDDAPNNSQQYVRSGGVWAPVDLSNAGGGGSDIGEPPRQGVYARKYGEWVKAPDSEAFPSTKMVGKLPDDPDRGKLYLTAGNVLAIAI